MHVCYEASATIITRVLVGKYLQAIVESRSGEAIDKLLGLHAETARVLHDGEERELAGRRGRPRARPDRHGLALLMVGVESAFGSQPALTVVGDYAIYGTLDRHRRARREAHGRGDEGACGGAARAASAGTVASSGRTPAPRSNGIGRDPTSSGVRPDVE